MAEGNNALLYLNVLESRVAISVEVALCDVVYFDAMKTSLVSV
jgi:hypothetical protein